MNGDDLTGKRVVQKTSQLKSTPSRPSRASYSDPAVRSLTV